MNDDKPQEDVGQSPNPADQPQAETPPRRTGKTRLDVAIAILGAVIGALFVIGSTILSPFLQGINKESNSLSGPSYHERIEADYDSSMRRSDEISKQTDRNLKAIDSMVTVLTRMNDSLTIVTRPSDDKILELLTSLDNRLTRLEKVIMDNPEKAVALPLLKRDIDNIKASQDARIESLNDSLSSSIDRLYTVIGTVTVVIGVGLVAGLYTTIAAKKQEQNQPKPRR